MVVFSNHHIIVSLDVFIFEKFHCGKEVFPMTQVCGNVKICVYVNVVAEEDKDEDGVSKNG